MLKAAIVTEDTVRMLANDQHDEQIFNAFITILYMFRAISCSSSGS
jgi:hypothetical protein